MDTLHALENIWVSSNTRLHEKYLVLFAVIVAVLGFFGIETTYHRSAYRLENNKTSSDPTVCFKLTETAMSLMNQQQQGIATELIPEYKTLIAPSIVDRVMETTPSTSQDDQSLIVREFGMQIFVECYQSDTVTVEQAKSTALRLASEATSAREARAAERNTGLHCLSNWDGSHVEFRNEVRQMMREPDSLEHIETVVTPKSDSGRHTIRMTYTAKNGFGGMTNGIAVGTYSHTTGLHDVLSVQ